MLVTSQCCTGGLLLPYLLTGATPLAHQRIAHKHTYGKHFIVVWANLTEHFILWCKAIDTLADLL